MLPFILHQMLELRHTLLAVKAERVFGCEFGGAILLAPAECCLCLVEVIFEVLWAGRG